MGRGNKTWKTFKGCGHMLRMWREPRAELCPNCRPKKNLTRKMVECKRCGRRVPRDIDFEGEFCTRCKRELSVPDYKNPKLFVPDGIYTAVHPKQHYWLGGMIYQWWELRNAIRRGEVEPETFLERSDEDGSSSMFYLLKKVDGEFFLRRVAV